MPGGKVVVLGGDEGVVVSGSVAGAEGAGVLGAGAEGGGVDGATTGGVVLVTGSGALGVGALDPLGSTTVRLYGPPIAEAA